MIKSKCKICQEIKRELLYLAKCSDCWKAEEEKEDHSDCDYCMMRGKFKV